jgi:deoxycytidylate deaminase
MEETEAKKNTEPYPRTELVIGLVGAVGIDLSAVYSEIETILGAFDYRSHRVHLTDQLPLLQWDMPLASEPWDERVASYMDAGNELRKRWDRLDAFALLAVNAITTTRAETTGDRRKPADRHAYVIQSIKRKEEAKLLRDVYGSRFILLSVYAPEKARRRFLKMKIRQSRDGHHGLKPVHPPKKLIARDQYEGDTHGQDVRGVFHQGDFFVDTTGDLHHQLQRAIEILFGHPNRTPTRDEFGMFQAVAAQRRSAELGRQVGAAICTPGGDVVAVGANEVPRAGGGLYWEGDDDDAREFTLGWDTSDSRQTELARQIAKDLDKAGWLKKGVTRARVVERIEQTDVGDLIEFIRAVHAEMAALMDAARRGISVADTVLYATTFPCHHCARHIVAAGIKRVVYVAPYPKSRAEGLHKDSIIIDPSHPRKVRRRVAFEPFVGIGPNRYLDLFAMPTRKDRRGMVVPFEPKKASPRVDEAEPKDVPLIEPGYIAREISLLETLEEVQLDPGPRFKEVDSEGSIEAPARSPDVRADHGTDDVTRRG